MSSTFIIILLWAAALSSGLMAGIYFAFSGFIMKSFAGIETTQSITAMNAINKTILRSWFMPLFFGSTIVSVSLVITAIINWGDVGAGLLLIAGMVYFVGMFICTIAYNVPLNNALASVDPASLDAASLWQRYLKTWTKWNHLRAASSLLSNALCVWLLSVH